MVVGARSCAGQSDGILAFSLSLTPHTQHTHYILLHYTRSPHPSLHSHSSPFCAPSAALDLASRRVENTRSQKPFLFSPNIPSTRAGLSSDGSRRAAGPYTPDDFLPPPQPSTRSAIPQLVVHRPSTSLSSIASSIGGVFRPGSARQQQQQQHRQDGDLNQEREEIVEPRPTPLYAMYNSTGADRQQHANNGDNRNSDMSAYEDDYAHQQQGNSSLNPGSARYSDYGTPTGGLDSRRDSYNADPASSGASPQMNEDLRKYHSQGGAYTNLGNEPSSPIMGHHHPQHQQASSSSRNQDDGDGDSNGDSSSNGSTKVDSRSPSAYRVRGAGAAGGQGYGMGGDSQAHGSESDIGHQYSDGGLYASRTANNSTGYVDAPLYHPSSPSSAQSHNTYGRFRTGSYPGLDSSRTSSIGTHDGVNGNIPYNTSRTALNNEWRQSVDTSHEINALNTPNEKYRDFGTPETEKDGKSYHPIPPSSPALGEKGAPLGAGKVVPVDGKKPEAAVVLSRVNRLAWIDGLRGLASLMIFAHHYKTLTWEIRFPNVLADGSTQGFITNGQLAVCLYFLLGGRVLAHGFQRSAYAPPKVAKDSHGAVIPGAPLIRSAGPKWLSLSSSLFRRSIRLAFPAIAVGFIQWQVCELGGTSTAITANLEFLRPTNLWEATWCEIGDFAGFLQFCLDLFTNQNHQWILYVGSALWTTYDQFWGSVMVYILAAMMAPMAWKGRYALFTVICIGLWYVSSPNMLYAIGLWLSDLHASGYVRKLQDHWKPTILIEICVMALALSMIAGGGTVATPANDAIGHITINNGRFGWNPDFAWPQYMFMSNWIPAVCIMIWLEISHAMQWFASWGLFVWIGKVSYGFYLMQFLTLYGLMPHLILALDNGSRSYWDVVTPTFIICLMFNFFVAWIAYHVLDRIGLKLGKWIWDGFFVTKPKNASAIPLKFAKHMADVLIHGPARAVHGTGKNMSSKWASIKSTTWTILHWRTRTVRPPIPAPTDPEVLAQLHSTRWTTDISGNKEAMRCHRLLKWQQWSWVFHLFFIPGMTVFWTIYHPTGQWTWDGMTFSTLWRFIWILSLPNCLAGWFGFMTPDWAPTKEQMDKKPVCREHIRNFFIVLVTKGSNENAVRRGYNKLVKLEKYHPAIKTIVLTDEPYVYPDLQNIVCPKDYVSPLGKAKYKARALDYLRYHVSLGVYDWILHMDEESVTDAESVRRCIDFIRYTPHHFGQGIILYNGEGYWENWYFTVADGIRVGDDLARFHFQNTVIQRPVFGVHGSFLLTNGEMENECTWDFGSLAEDFEFSQDAWRRGFTCGRVHGIVREQSPGTLRDFLKQRRRWYMGIRDIKGMYGLPHLAVNLWTVGVFTLAVTIINLPFTLIDKSLTPLWLAIIANFCFITFYTIYTWGLLFQELDYGQKWWMIPIHLIPGILIQPFASISEGLAAIWAMSSEDFGKFEVIQKR